ncbi:hypothetical protein BGZ70_008722 [Mortierella alpina]|uniref:Mif2 N-terminal domain-containing protein n=1 Tax=Mortierella alpina TaxID=64518 RepID=A0A9P6M6L6_MORAP|nr:hypothetical protein BGZ70_008722 [Mortierella alpina]
MGTTHEGSVRVRGNRFFDIGVVGRRTGITVKPNVKKDADGLDNIDDFWDDENDTSVAPAPLKGQTRRQEMHPHQPTSLHPYHQPVVEAQELELSRRQHPPRMNEYIDPELVEDVLHDIPEELLSTPASRTSRSELNSTGSNPVYTSASDRPQAQEGRMLLSAIQDSSREEYPPPSFQAVKRRIDFTEDLSDAEPEFTRTPISHLGAPSYRDSNPRRQRMGMDSQEERANRDLGKRTPNTLSASANRMEAYRPLLSHAEIMSPSRIGGSTSSHIRYTGSSKAFDFELADSGSVSGPDDVVDEVDENDDSPQLPETPSRASHSILVSATPVHLRVPLMTAPTSRSRVDPEKTVFEEKNYHKMPPVAAAYQFSDEEETQDHEHEGDNIASKREENRLVSLIGRESVAEAFMREQEPSDASVSDDDASPKRRTIRPRRAVITKKPATDIPDQAKRAAPTRSNKNKPRPGKTKDAIAATASIAERSGLELRKRKEPSQERTALTVVPVERKGKPMDEDGPGVRRSNRVTFKPLEYWRNERVILGRSENTPQPVPVIKGVVRAPPPEPVVARGTKRTRGHAQSLTNKPRAKVTTRSQRSRTRRVDDGAEADEEDDDHSSDSESLRQQGFTQRTDQTFECIDQATGAIAVRALTESKGAMRFQDVPGGHYQYHRGLEDEDTISSVKVIYACWTSTSGHSRVGLSEQGLGAGSLGSTWPCIGAAGEHSSRMGHLLGLETAVKGSRTEFGEQGNCNNSDTIKSTTESQSNCIIYHNISARWNL